MTGFINPMGNFNSEVFLMTKGTKKNIKKISTSIGYKI